MATSFIVLRYETLVIDSVHLGDCCPRPVGTRRKDLDPRDALTRGAVQTVGMSRLTSWSRRPRHFLAASIVLCFLAVSCSSAPAPVGEPAPTTEAQPREVAEPETTTSTSTTSTEPPPPPSISLSILGSLRSLPSSQDAVVGAVDPTATDETATTVAAPIIPAPAILADDATVASLACTRSSGCEPTDLAAWAANTLDAVNLATSAAVVDGTEVLDEHAAALLASGVATIGYGPSLDEALEPVIVGANNRPVAMYGISLAEGLPAESIASTTGPGIVAGGDAFELLVEQISLSQDSGHHVVVFVDFGRLEGRAPTPTDVELVLAVVDSGADAIVGHGSDFLQRFERIDQTAVVFSLGNAVTDTDNALRQDTAIFSLTFATDGTSSCLFPATGSAVGVAMDDPDILDCP